MECPERSTKKGNSFILSDYIISVWSEQRGKYTKDTRLRLADTFVMETDKGRECEHSQWPFRGNQVRDAS